MSPESNRKNVENLTHPSLDIFSLLIFYTKEEDHFIDRFSVVSFICASLSC